MSTAIPPTAASAPPAEPWSGMAVSLTFWLMLLTAAGLFAVVSLTPKLAAYLTLEAQHRTQQQELVDLEQQHGELERVIAALKDDPHFAAEMARLEFDAVRPGEEILSMDTALSLEPRTAAKPHLAHSVPSSAWRPWVAVMAYNQPLRTALLVTAATLVLWAFGWMQDRAET